MSAGLRRWPRLGPLATALAVPLAILGLAAAYVRLELADPASFADRAVSALRSQQVRDAVAEQVAVGVVERGSPDLVASRPLVLAAVEAVLDTDAFARVMRRTAIAVHEALLEGDRDIVVELQESTDVLVPALRSVAPQVAREIPRDLAPRIAEIRRSDAATATVRVAQGSGWAAPVLLVLAGLLLAVGVLAAADRRQGLLRCGVGLIAIGALGLVTVAALRAQVVSHADELGVLSRDDARAAAGAAWDALASGLDRVFLVTGLGGLALVAGAVLAQARLDRAAALRVGGELLAGEGLPMRVRALRGAALAAVGALIALGNERVRAAAALTLGGALAVLGLAELVSLAPRAVERRAHRPGRRRHRLALAAVVGLVAVGLGVTALATRGGGADPPPPEQITACNGLRALCGRRLDQVVFPGTHNSMSAADRPGWFFANQTRPISRQLRDGIRLLMIDVHYGVADPRGRIRTDLEAEGTTRNRVAARLGRPAVRAAEQLAGRLGLVPSEGERDLYLCHTLCELGAERMADSLRTVRGFLEHHRTEVVLVFVESSVEPRDVERAFADAELEPYLAALPRGGEPLPTLREMVASGRRLVVLDERDGGDEPWYQPGFLFVQDTVIGSLLHSATACEANRGSPDSPLVLMNHWIDRFPPPATENAAVGDAGTLVRRLRACAGVLGRRPNLLAVDFYDDSDVIAVARRLNASGPRSLPAG